MARYAFIVGADHKYTPELCANLNSLDFVGSKADVHVIGINLDGSFTEQFSKLSYKAIHHKISEAEVKEARGISEITCRKRYWYAGELGKDYDAVCVLDADLIFNRDPHQFFEIAAKTGFILGPTKEQNKVYDEVHQETDGKWQWGIERGHWNDKDMCNCPLFIDAKKYELALKKSWDVFLNHGFKAPDMDAMNLCFMEAAGTENLLTLPGLQWLGTNEQHLKPYIRVVSRRDERLWTECGIPIYCYHGHYYHEKWRKCQIDNRHNCAKGYLKATECCDNIAQGSMNLLYTNFLKMLDWKIEVEKKNYRPQ
jgi:hypothetical protein